MQVVNDHIGKCQLLLLTTFLEAALHHTATMLVRTYLYAVRHASVKDELGKSLEMFTSLTVRLLWILRSLEDAEEGLNYMVSMGTLQIIRLIFKLNLPDSIPLFEVLDSQ